MRQRQEIPLSFSDNILNGEEIDNVDAELLARLYNPAHPAFFEAFIKGAHHKDLRFIVKDRGGALAAIDSPEEVALVNNDPGGMEDGILYLSHKLAEYKSGTASSSEDKRFVSARKYSIETAIGNNDHLTSAARIEFGTVLAGERVLRFLLLPNLRVARVTDTAPGKTFSLSRRIAALMAPSMSSSRRARARVKPTRSRSSMQGTKC